MIERRQSLPTGELVVEELTPTFNRNKVDLELGRQVGRQILAHVLRGGEDFTRQSDPDPFDAYRYALEEQTGIPLTDDTSLGDVLRLAPASPDPRQETGGTLHRLSTPGLSLPLDSTGEYIVGDVHLYGTEAAADYSTENDYALTMQLLANGVIAMSGSVNTGALPSDLMEIWNELHLHQTLPLTPETGLTISNEPLGDNQALALAEHVAQRL